MGLTKGRLTIASTGDYREFSLNPSKIKDTKGWASSDQGIAGISDPAFQGGHGTVRKISFTLRLDADVGYRGTRQGGSDLFAAWREGREVQGKPYDITDEVAWYRQFVYTEGDARLGEIDAAPPVLLFSFGPMYQGLRCKLLDADYEILTWDQNLKPVRADLNVTLRQVITESVNRSDIYNSSRNRVF